MNDTSPINFEIHNPRDEPTAITLQAIELIDTELWHSDEAADSESIEADLNKKHIVAAYNEEGQVVAAGTMLDEDQVEVPHIITAIATRNDSRRAGIGREVLERLEGIATQKGAKGVAVDSTLEAYDFYKNCGYKKVGEGHGFYKEFTK